MIANRGLWKEKKHTSYYKLVSMPCDIWHKNSVPSCRKLLQPFQPLLDKSTSAPSNRFSPDCKRNENHRHALPLQYAPIGRSLARTLAQSAKTRRSWLRRYRRGYRNLELGAGNGKN